MPGILHIAETVITGDLLSRAHESQDELSVPSGAILTPTAWDYVRDNGLRLTRTDEPGGPATLVRAAWGEVLVGVLVLSATAVLAGTAPPESLP
jgi:hypothetical protein